MSIDDFLEQFARDLEQFTVSDLARFIDDEFFGAIVNAELDRRRCRRLAREFEAKDAKVH